MSILVVGGSGRVGKEVTLQLARRDIDVTALLRGGRSHPSSKQLLDAGVRVVEGDLRSPETLTEAVNEIETVICTATSMPSATDDGIRKVDHDGTLALIDAAERHGVKRFVYVSYSANIRYDSPLETAKRTCENRLLTGSMQAIILRPSYFMEMWLSPILGFDPANRSARIYGSGESKISYISYSNVADFAVALATGKSSEKNTVLELGGPESLSQLEAVGIFEKSLSTRIKIDHVPVEALRAQHNSSDPLQNTFAALMLGYADGDVVENAIQTALRYQVQLRSVAQYASRLLSPAAVG